ncbi:magnesium and cobalt transporter CorA [Streptococcus urinalis FB127-CNA-2]|uniref:Magnesium and cobalt transport protein CorA n=1 Tax=Streptococcus urinalis 2285-97 TaxID=764291 RepID=G5KHE9_9STRE|nr:CorA family divalent cation transporter [Streptococcus urinalis]EHJ55894.1 putative magnesium and cobalt transport protein CorA [Streptococcus urinalis 2285-97]EKS22507.1 magnesium and cobalt transporter CorA [Streptococcus urinalis FB127-CNA-2]VEF32320.1 Zinc transport protein zntB [Streptococcus urinalis]
MFYKVSEKLEKTSLEECLDNHFSYIAILSTNEWITFKEKSHLHLEIEFPKSHIKTSHIYHYQDKLIGQFSTPDRKVILNQNHHFSFLIQKNTLIFIDDSQFCQSIFNDLRKDNHWKDPDLGRILFDFLDKLIQDDVSLLEKFGMTLTDMEGELLEGKDHINSNQLSQIRHKIVKLDFNYSQFATLTEELSHDTDHLFTNQNLNNFRLLSIKIDHLQHMIESLKDDISQIKGMQQSIVDEKQNHIMTVLTIVTTCCTPITIIVGWYGMNFDFMPELNSPLGYPIVIIVSILILIINISYFKHKKWL